MVQQIITCTICYNYITVAQQTFLKVILVKVQQYTKGWRDILNNTQKDGVTYSHVIFTRLCGFRISYVIFHF